MVGVGHFEEHRFEERDNPKAESSFLYKIQPDRMSQDEHSLEIVDFQQDLGVALGIGVGDRIVTASQMGVQGYQDH